MRVRRWALGTLRSVLAGTILSTPMAAQERPQSSGAVLPFGEFAAQVRAHHPVARQAALVSDQARAEQQVARGAFDPVLSAAWDRKTFGSTEYYDYATAKLTVPTPFGVDMVVGYERADGRYVSPDRRTPTSGLLSAGLSVPIGQRILTVERRTALAVARGLRGAADADRDAALNRLHVQATRDYAGWYEAWRRAAIAREGLSLAEFRLRAVRQRVRAGEAAAIDTIEAGLEVQRRLVQREEAAQSLFAARLAAEAHLWSASGEPAAMPEHAAPAIDRQTPLPAVDSASVEGWVAFAARAHPEVRRASGRTDQTEAQRRLAAQQLLPAVELQAAALADRGTGRLPTTGASADDAKLGVTAKLPHLVLRERGRLAGAVARDEQQRWELARVRRDVAVVVRTAANDLSTLDRLLLAQEQVVAQVRLLLAGELRRFEAGESTLFLVNTRERAVLDEEVRRAGLEARRLIARSAFVAAIGGSPDATRDR
jgi:outer membrane protein TolC